MNRQLVALAASYPQRLAVPDGTMLLVLTGGYNRNTGANGRMIPRNSNEYAFVCDLASRSPVQKQAIHIPNT